MQAMEYRSDFISWMLVDTGWSLMDFIFFTSLINYTQVIGDWNKGQSLIVLGIFRLMVIPVWGWMFNSFHTLPRLLSEGKLDMIITKPADSQFLVSTRSFSFSILPSLFSGTVFTLMGFSLLHLSLNMFQVVVFFWLIFVSVVLIYALYFLTMTAALFTDRLDNIYHIFTALYDSSKYPAQIYPVFWQRFLTTVFPLALMIIVPAESLFVPINFSRLVQFHLLTLFFLIVSRRIWFRGLRRYSSASS
jgi:ABC-2 type transport system permease protein